MFGCLLCTPKKTILVCFFALCPAEAVKQQAQLSLEVADLVLDIVDKLKHVTPAEEAAAQAAVQAAAAAAAAPARRTTRSAAAAAAQAGPAAAAAVDANHAEAYKAALKPFVVRSQPRYTLFCIPYDLVVGRFVLCDAALVSEQRHCCQ